MTPTKPATEGEPKSFPFRVTASDFYNLRPAIDAYAAEWISAGKLKECIQAWINGADFTDPKMRTWDEPDQKTAKEELCELLMEAATTLGGMPLTDFQELAKEIRKRLEREGML